MSSHSKNLKVLFVAAEMTPIVKVGGLGDVVGSLPKALLNLGLDVRVLLPKYKDIHVYTSAMGSIDCEFANKNHRVCLYESLLSRQVRLPIYYLENQQYLSDGEIYPVSAKKALDRYLFFQKAATGFLEQWGFKPDIIHVHDWHTSLIPLLLSFSPVHYWEIIGLPKPKAIITLHNIGQKHGPFIPVSYLKRLNFLPKEVLADIKEKEVTPWALGLKYFDIVTTVSPTYKKEILKSDRTFSKDESFYGILNGIDTRYWSITKNKYLPFLLKQGIDGTYPARDKAILKFKSACKNKLFKEIGVKTELNQKASPHHPVSLLRSSENDSPIFSFIGRLYSQKGLDILLPAIKKLLTAKNKFYSKSANTPPQAGMKRYQSTPPKAEHKAEENHGRQPVGFYFILLGQGNEDYVKEIYKLKKQFPENIFPVIEFNEPLSHLIYGASDFIVVPSLYEPCGLVQMIAMHYTSIPLVRKTGGLADTVSNKEGIVFNKYSVDELKKAFEKALRIYRNKKLMLKLIKHDLSLDFSWNKSAKEYVKLYQKALVVKSEDLIN